MLCWSTALASESLQNHVSASSPSSSYSSAFPQNVVSVNHGEENTLVPNVQDTDEYPGSPASLGKTLPSATGGYRTAFKLLSTMQRYPKLLQKEKDGQIDQAPTPRSPRWRHCPRWRH